MSSIDKAGIIVLSSSPRHGKKARRRIGLTALVATLTLITAILCGCQTIENSAPTQTMVRVVDASQNAPSVDVKVGTTEIAADIGAGTFTDYAFLPPENGTAYVYPTGTTTMGVTAQGEFEVAQQHSVLITDSAGIYGATILADQAVAAPAGFFSIRFLQQAAKAGAVDIYLVPSTATLAGTKALFSGVKPQAVEGYVNVPAGTYTLVVTPTGVLTTPYTSSMLTFVDGQVRTALIMDAQLTTNPPVNVVMGNDVD